MDKKIYRVRKLRFRMTSVHGILFFRRGKHETSTTSSCTHEQSEDHADNSAVAEISLSLSLACSLCGQRSWEVSPATSSPAKSILYESMRVVCVPRITPKTGFLSKNEERKSRGIACCVISDRVASKIIRHVIGDYINLYVADSA